MTSPTPRRRRLSSGVAVTSADMALWRKATAWEWLMRCPFDTNALTSAAASSSLWARKPPLPRGPSGRCAATRKRWRSSSTTSAPTAEPTVTSPAPLPHNSRGSSPPASVDITCARSQDRHPLCVRTGLCVPCRCFGAL
ncbi:hypothetical protein HMI54_009226 [Coelomomyces lativittatus]|nr:hypothetical protein HMI54_009226 [Coelomomyces lativittatus]